MFEQFGQFASLLKNLPKMKAELEKIQSQLAQVTAEAESGGGLVRAKVNGQMEVVRLTLSDDALKDRELLEDLIAAAVNQAMKKVKQSVAEQTANLAGGLGLPPGMSP